MVELVLVLTFLYSFDKGLGGGSGPQRLIRALGIETGNPSVEPDAFFSCSRFCFPDAQAATAAKDAATSAKNKSPANTAASSLDMNAI